MYGNQLELLVAAPEQQLRTIAQFNWQIDHVYLVRILGVPGNLYNGLM